MFFPEMLRAGVDALKRCGKGLSASLAVQIRVALWTAYSTESVVWDGRYQLRTQPSVAEGLQGTHEVHFEA
jgi:hypothetical protein